MTVYKVKGIQKFRKGMILKSSYAWEGEPTRHYYYRVTKPEHKGEGAYADVYLKRNGNKFDKMPRNTFLWDFQTQIGHVRRGSGWGRTVLIKKGRTINLRRILR